MMETLRRYSACSICFENLLHEEYPVCAMACGHVFHYACISRWLAERERSCPICRSTQNTNFLLRLYMEAIDFPDSPQDQTPGDYKLQYEIATYQLGVRNAQNNALENRLLEISECNKTLRQELGKARCDLMSIHAELENIRSAFNSKNKLFKKMKERHICIEKSNAQLSEEVEKLISFKRILDEQYITNAAINSFDPQSFPAILKSVVRKLKIVSQREQHVKKQLVMFYNALVKERKVSKGLQETLKEKEAIIELFKKLQNNAYQGVQHSHDEKTRNDGDQATRTSDAGKHSSSSKIKGDGYVQLQFKINFDANTSKARDADIPNQVTSLLSEKIAAATSGKSSEQAQPATVSEYSLRSSTTKRKSGSTDDVFDNNYDGLGGHSKKETAPKLKPFRQVSKRRRN